jgi:large subunit ribosomal protein L30
VLSNKPESINDQPSRRSADTGGPHLRVTLIKSPVGNNERQRRTVRALGLTRMHQTVEHPDGLVARGMIAKVAHLVEVEEVK